MADDDVLDSLRRDLQDGEDLALAMRLVSDALDRRLDRVHRSLDRVVRADPTLVDGLADRVRRQMATHEESLDLHRERLAAAVDELQRVMDEAATALDED